MIEKIEIDQRTGKFLRKWRKIELELDTISPNYICSFKLLCKRYFICMLIFSCMQDKNLKNMQCLPELKDMIEQNNTRYQPSKYLSIT